MRSPGWDDVKADEVSRTQLMNFGLSLLIDQELP